MIGLARDVSPTAPPSSSMADPATAASRTRVSSCGCSRTAAWTFGSDGPQTFGSSAAAKSATEPARSAPRAVGSTKRSPMNAGIGGLRTRRC